MKIGDRVFPYPIVSDAATDYTEGNFAANDVREPYAVSGIIQFECELDLRCPPIQRLIAEGKARYALHIECPSTSYRELLKRRDGHFQHSLAADCVKGALERTALVVATEEITDFTSEEFTSDFTGLSFDIPRGGILAHTALDPMNIDQKLAVDVGGHSIFTVYKQPRTGQAPMTVEFSRDSIDIGVGEQEYKYYSRLADNPALQPVLNSMLVMPALVYTLEQLRDGDEFENYEDREWFKTLDKTMSASGSSLYDALFGEDRQVTTIELAQMLMQNPLLPSLSGLMQSDEDDEQ